MADAKTLIEDGVQIRIFRETRDKLRAMGRKGESYDDIIRRLMEKEDGR